MPYIVMNTNMCALTLAALEKQHEQLSQEMDEMAKLLKDIENALKTLKEAYVSSQEEKTV